MLSPFPRSPPFPAKTQAKENKLQPADYMGGTFTISNLVRREGGREQGAGAVCCESMFGCMHNRLLNAHCKRHERQQACDANTPSQMLCMPRFATNKHVTTLLPPHLTHTTNQPTNQLTHNQPQGMFGIKQFAAIVNPPQAAILAVGAALPKVGGVMSAGLWAFSVNNCCHSVFKRQWLWVRGAQQLKRSAAAPFVASATTPNNCACLTIHVVVTLAVVLSHLLHRWLLLTVALRRFV